MTSQNKPPRVLRPQTRWEDLFFYQKAVTLYQLTFAFAERFLQKGDRTIDQMVQAARSGKQNIVEGSADGRTSTEMELRLLNVARSSIQELREDYADYLGSRRLQRWDVEHPRYEAMLTFCRDHNKEEDYKPHYSRWTDEEMANTALTLCFMIDKMMTSYITKLEKQFTEEGGIKERMTAARLGYRTNQREELQRLQTENTQLKANLQDARKRIKELETELDKLRMEKYPRRYPPRTT